MNFGFLGGLNEAFRSYDQGVQTNIDRAGVAEDRAYQRTQRDLQQKQQQRMVDEQGRDDALRDRLIKIKPAGAPADVIPAQGGGSDALTDPSSIDAQNGSDAGAPNVAAAPRIRTQDEELRDVASAYRQRGDVAKSLGLSAQADQIGMARHAKMMQDILANSTGKTAVELATAAKGIYDSDPLGGSVTSIVDLGNGAARVTIADRDTGRTITNDYKDAAAVAQGLQAHYDPTTYAATIKARYEHKLKQEDATAKIRDEVAGKVAVEKSKTVIVPSGATALIDGKSVLHNPREFRPVTPAAVKPGDTPQDLAADAVTRAVKNSDTKFASPEQSNEATLHAVKLVTENPDLAPDLAARMGIKITLHPEIVKPEVNVKTGLIDSVVKDDLTGDAFAVRRGVGAPGALPASVTPEMANDMAADLTKRLDKRQPGMGDLYARAAHDPSGRARVAVEAAERKLLAARLAAIPAFTQATPDQQRQSLDKAFSMESPNIQNRLDMILKYGNKPTPQKGGSPSVSSRIQAPGGLLPGGADGSDKAWVRNRLMGPFDGPGKLKEIAQTNANPKFRAAAQALYDEAIGQSSSIDTSGTGAPL